MIFPEGTRSRDGEIHQFKKGGLAIALEIGMDVVPLAVCGTGAIVEKKSFRLNRGQVEMKVGEPIRSADWEGSSKSDFSDHVRRQVVIMKSSWKDKKTMFWFFGAIEKILKTIFWDDLGNFVFCI